MILTDQLVNSTESSEDTSAIETTLRRAAARRSLIYGSGKEFNKNSILKKKLYKCGVPYVESDPPIELRIL